MTTNAVEEIFKCDESAAYFVHEHCQIYDATLRTWIPFKLWKEQYRTLKLFLVSLLVIVLKARQLGQTWLALCYALWLMLYRAQSTVLLFSRRDDESMAMLKRLREVYTKLPEYMHVRAILQDSAHTWELSNGSIAHAFPTNAGDSYTATLVIVDEADLITDLDALMRAVKPTTDGGGQLLLISRADKGRPNSPFKNIYRGAKAGLTKWRHTFLPWWVRPGRDEEWYEDQKADIFARTGSLDDLYEQYPATDEEALSARTLDRRLSPLFLRACFVEKKGLVIGETDQVVTDVPYIPGLTLYSAPKPKKEYVGGVDTAEGNPNSNDSSITIVEKDTGVEVAKLAGLFEVATFGGYCDRVGQYFNMAPLLVERNNHGHAVILWLKDNGHVKLLSGDAEEVKRKKPGWLDNSRGKTLLYDNLADTTRDGDCVIHSYSTFVQLSSIGADTLSAPEGDPDDEADSYALAQYARRLKAPGGWAGLDGDGLA